VLLIAIEKKLNKLDRFVQKILVLKSSAQIVWIALAIPINHGIDAELLIKDGGIHFHTNVKLGNLGGSLGLIRGY
jgi:hypothetical protein